MKFYENPIILRFTNGVNRRRKKLTANVIASKGANLSRPFPIQICNNTWNWALLHRKFSFYDEIDWHSLENIFHIH